MRNLDPERPDGDFVRGYGYQGMAMALEGRLMARATPGFGVAFKQALRQPPAWGFFLGSFADCLPHRDNRVTLDTQLVDRHGVPQVRFDVRFGANEEKLRNDAAAQGRAMPEAAGLQYVQSILYPSTPGDAIHEMGGACRGRDPKILVLNSWNQAHEVPSLYVTDGSSMCPTGVVNPSLTFMALTARAADRAAGLWRDGAI